MATRTRGVDPRPVGIRDGEVLPGSEFCNQRRRDDDQQKATLQQKQQNQRDKDGCRDDPFHDLKKDTRSLLVSIHTRPCYHQA